MKKRPAEVEFWYRFNRVGTLARPSAKPFLRALAEHYDVKILTHGYSIFQARVLKELKLLEFVSGIYGSDNFENLSKPEQFVLIDDMPRQSILITYKMDWLGRNKFKMSEIDYNAALDRHHIQCAAYDGTADAYPLTNLLPIIHRYMK